MLMKEFTDVSNRWCFPVSLFDGAILFDPGLLSTRSKIIKYKYSKNANKIMKIMTMKSDTNQLQPGKGVGFKPKNISVGYSFQCLVPKFKKVMFYHFK